MTFVIVDFLHAHQDELSRAITRSDRSREAGNFRHSESRRRSTIGLPRQRSRSAPTQAKPGT